MSASVTPARRRRSIEDVDGEDEISVDGETLPQSSSRSKRTRVDNDDDDDGPLLPDGYRRSPKNKQPAHTPDEHRPGSIVRVTLTNFVTYTKAEFHPGPNLNMIIGPNGTGKSTLVCAICLGLGFPASLLGRAKNVSEFVKHGTKKAEIEIELAAGPDQRGKNPVITTRISKEDNKAEFFIDGKKTTKKKLDELMRSFSIQVDNLCQFLPQDKVVEFAALSPVGLLKETERAAASQQMCDWHEELKTMRKEQKIMQAEQEEGFGMLKQMENRQNAQEADVTRLRERAHLQAKLAGLGKLRPFPEYSIAIKRHDEAKQRKKQAEKEKAKLERQLEPNMRAEQEKKDYIERITQVVTSRGKLVDRAEQRVDELSKAYDKKQEAIEECAKEIESEKKTRQAAIAKMPTLQRNVTLIQNAMQTPPAEVDLADLNQRLREYITAGRELDDKVEEVRTKAGSLGQRIQHRKNQLEQASQEKETLQSQAGQLAGRLRMASRDAAKAWEWIQANRDKFTGEVFGPPIIECSVKDPRNAAAVESAIGTGDMLAFTVTTQEDFRMLGRQLIDEMRLSDVNIRSSVQPLDYFRAPCSTDQLRALGLEGYILDLMEGPEAVLAMLCDNRNIHQAGFTSREISQQQLTAIGNSQISSWVTQTTTYQIARRREYGDKATSTRTTPIRAARFFTAAAAATYHEDADLERRIQDLERQNAEAEEQRRELGKGFNEAKAERKKLADEEAALREEKNQKQAARAQFNALPTKLEGAKKKLSDAQELIAASRQRSLAIVEKGDKLTLEKGQAAVDWANAVEALRGLLIQRMEANIVLVEAQSDFDQLSARTVEERRLLAERKKEVDELTRIKAGLLEEGKRLGEECRQVGLTFTDYEHELHQSISGWDPAQLETEIQSVQAQVEINSGGAGGAHTLKEFEERAKKIEKKRARLAEVEGKLAELEGRIAEVREQWEPQLDELIAKISAAFKENFERISCAGEVAVHKDEDFEQWAIQIKVKFREHESLSLLDSHRQSGGERAVSTIFYLMALQSLARAPFRVVDEINQGMDSRNERLVHSRMVDIACAEGGSGSQYFLITPKLLSGLRYARGMKVHCIASGEYMPKDGHKSLDFEGLVKKALEGKRRVGAMAA